jgi:hypothetical protein
MRSRESSRIRYDLRAAMDELLECEWLPIEGLISNAPAESPLQSHTLPKSPVANVQIAYNTSDSRETP